MTSLCSRFANYSKLLEPNNVHRISERERERGEDRGRRRRGCGVSERQREKWTWLLAFVFAHPSAADVAWWLLSKGFFFSSFQQFFLYI